MNLIKELLLLIKGDIAYDDATLNQYSRDASAFEVRPKVVVFPKDTEDVKALVRFVSRHKTKHPELSLTVRSGGTDMSGGPLNESIIVDVSRYMHAIGDVDERERTITVEPGAFYRDFERKTLKHNLLMPSYPASREICTVGGMVANNAGGEKSLAYGKTERFVHSVKAVLADGNEYVFGPLSAEEVGEKLRADGAEGALYRSIYTLVTEHCADITAARPNVTKNSAGYYLWNVWSKETGVFDLSKIIVGSQGTLGVVTEITFRLVRPKRRSQLLVVFLPDLAGIPRLVASLLPFEPESLESYDDKTLKLVLRYFSGFVRQMGARNVFKLAWQFLPEVRAALTKGFPRLVVLAEFTGSDPREVASRAQRARGAAVEHSAGTHLVRSKGEARKYWTIRREAFNLIRNHLKNERSVPFIDDVVVRPEKLPEFFPRLFAILKPYREHVRFALGGHSGSGNFHIYTIVKKGDPAVAELIPEVSAKVYDLVVELEGSITAEHNDGLIRSPFLSRMYGEYIMDLFRQVKDIFDPQNIFNPGKKVYASWEYALKHIKKE